MVRSKLQVVCLYFFSLTLLPSCFLFTHFQPLSPSEVRRLTTCPNKSLAEVKKNLALMGYQTGNESSDYVTTDWLGGSDATRITAVSKGKNVEFRVFKKETWNRQVETGSVEVVDPISGRSTTRYRQKSNVPQVTEGPEEYRKGHIDDYQRLHGSVCGTSRS